MGKWVQVESGQMVSKQHTDSFWYIFVGNTVKWLLLAMLFVSQNGKTVFRFYLHIIKGNDFYNASTFLAHALAHLFNLNNF